MKNKFETSTHSKRQVRIAHTNIKFTFDSVVSFKRRIDRSNLNDFSVVISQLTDKRQTPAAHDSRGGDRHEMEQATAIPSSACAIESKAPLSSAAATTTTAANHEDNQAQDALESHAPLAAADNGDDDLDDESMRTLRIAFVGNVDSGKSSLIGMSCARVLRFRRVDRLLDLTHALSLSNSRQAR